MIRMNKGKGDEIIEEFIKRMREIEIERVLISNLIT